MCKILMIVIIIVSSMQQVLYFKIGMYLSHFTMRKLRHREGKEHASWSEGAETDSWTRML
jgi:hypothetical protein